MESKLRILRFFADHNREAFSINAVAKALSINYRIAYETIQELAKRGNITMEKFGQANRCRFNHAYNDLALRVETAKRDELLQDKNLKILHRRLLGIESPFLIALVFGSHATKTHTPHSDIDLCIITDDDTAKEEAEQRVKVLPLDIHLLSFTTKEFRAMLRTREENVGKEIVKNKVVLLGTEALYALMDYARARTD